MKLFQIHFYFQIHENIIFDFDYVQTVDGTTNFTIENLPGDTTSSFSSPSLSADGVLTLTISNLTNISRGTYEVTITGDNGNETKSRNVSFEIYEGNFERSYYYQPDPELTPIASLMPYIGSFEWYDPNSGWFYDNSVNSSNLDDFLFAASCCSMGSTF